MKHGIPLTKEELEEWQKAFQDIEDSIKNCKEVKNDKKH